MQTLSLQCFQTPILQYRHHIIDGGGRGDTALHYRFEEDIACRIFDEGRGLLCWHCPSPLPRVSLTF